MFSKVAMHSSRINDNLTRGQLECNSKMANFMLLGTFGACILLAGCMGLKQGFRQQKESLAEVTNGMKRCLLNENNIAEAVSYTWFMDWQQWEARSFVDGWKADLHDMGR